MAIPRLSVKVGKKGKAQPHAAYIARLDKYAHRLESGEKLEATGHGNMPAWAADDPLSFWQAADLHERKNGSTYREHEIALPRELSESQRHDLLDDWIKNEIGDKYAFQYAIHNPTSADGKDNPHVHLMFSERRLDGIERGSDQFFKRYNGKAPERGGAKKENTGKGHTERRQNLKDLRRRWEELCNEHLERAGSDVRIDMQSYKDQGKDIMPEKKIGPKAWRNPKRKAEVMELRQIKRDLLEFVGDAKKFLQRLQAKKKETSQKQWLSPENIEKVYNGIFEQAEAQTKKHYAKLDKNHAQNDKAWHIHYETKPEEPTGVLASFSKKKYKKQLESWEEEEKRLRLARANSKNRCDFRFQTVDSPKATTERIFREQHPDLHKEKLRLEALAKENEKHERLKREQQEAYDRIKREQSKPSPAPSKKKYKGIEY